MSDKPTIKGIFLEKLNRILNPNFERKFISRLMSLGIFLLGYQSIVDLLLTVEFLSREYYIKLSLSSGPDMFSKITGALLIIISVILFCTRNRNKYPKKYKSLSKASVDIRPIMEDNRRIFTAFGPNSGYGNVENLKKEFEVWENLKNNQIVPNNDVILSILNRVKSFKDNELIVVNKMKSHIQAFKEHCSNPNFSYTENQFPLDFADLVFSYCKSKKNNITKYSKWLQNELEDGGMNIESVYIFGSALYGQEKEDVDVLIKTSEVEIEKIKEFSSFAKELKGKFVDEFSLKLHLKVYSELEKVRFTNFLDKIYNYKKVI